MTPVSDPLRCTLCGDAVQIADVDTHLRSAHLGSAGEGFWACLSCPFRAVSSPEATAHAVRRRHAGIRRDDSGFQTALATFLSHLRPRLMITDRAHCQSDSPGPEPQHIKRARYQDDSRLENEPFEARQPERTHYQNDPDPISYEPQSPSGDRLQAQKLYTPIRAVSQTRPQHTKRSKHQNDPEPIPYEPLEQSAPPEKQYTPTVPDIPVIETVRVRPAYASEEETGTSPVPFSKEDVRESKSPVYYVEEARETVEEPMYGTDFHYPARDPGSPSQAEGSLSPDEDGSPRLYETAKCRRCETTVRPGEAKYAPRRLLAHVLTRGHGRFKDLYRCGLCNLTRHTAKAVVIHSRREHGRNCRPMFVGSETEVLNEVMDSFPDHGPGITDKIRRCLVDCTSH